MKNWEPFVLRPEFAIATTPSVYALVCDSSSSNQYPGPPRPVPVGSPHCRKRYPPPLLIRWQVVLV